MKLPKLSLHSFSGEITQWLPFWDSFKSAVHSNDQLTGVDKSNYLKSLLTGTALECISGLTLSDANYQEAVAILEKWFGNHQRIIDRHMDQLLNVTAVKSANDLSALRRLFDQVETHVRGLKSLGVAADTYGSLLLSVLFNKLPGEIRLLISRKVPEGEWGLDSLLEELEGELQARERVAVDKPPSNGSGRGGRQSPHNTYHCCICCWCKFGTPACCYCQQGHPARDCRVVTQPEARKQILRKSGRCFVCLRTGHMSRECRSKLKCNKCSRRHHMSICSGESVGTRGSSNRTSGAGTAQGVPAASGRRAQNQEAGAGGTGLNVNASAFPPQNTASLYVTSNQTVLLQTAWTTVQNPSQPTVHRDVRAVLDLGSQRSYIRAGCKITVVEIRRHTEDVYFHIWILRLNVV